jgi:hypothetical protein
MSNFFEDATAYPCIIVFENSPPAEDYEIDIVYGRKKPIDSEVVSVLEEVREFLPKPGAQTTEHYMTYKTVFSDLSDREWRFTPKEANQLFRTLQSRRDYELTEVVDQISAGIKTGKNTVFIISEQKAQEEEIEESLLMPIFRGSDVERFKMEESEEYLIYTEGIEIADYPNAHDYLRRHKEALQGRKDATFRNKDKKWYELNVPHSTEDMAAEKIICPEMSIRNNYSLNKDGRYILNKVFFFHPDENLVPNSEYLLGLLNSTTLEFFLKQTSSPLQNGYYQFLTRYQERLPVKFSQDQEAKVTALVDQIRESIDTQNRIDSFPERYVLDYEGELDYIDYEWQTRRYPVDATIAE